MTGRVGMASNKISVHSLADLKNTSDDAIPNYLNSLKFRQSHTLTDVRLALGYTAFAVCAACFYWDYMLGWDATKNYTAAAVAIYTCLNGALTFWIWFVEKGIVYVGTSPSGEKIEIATSTKKHSPMYRLVVTTTAHGQRTTFKLAYPFTDWFDAAGNFVPLPFQQMFAGSIPLIGLSDPTKVTKETPLLSNAEAAELQAALDTIAALDASGAGMVQIESPEPNPTGKHSGKGRKRA